MTTISETLVSRGISHGNATIQFALAQELKETMRGLGLSHTTSKYEVQIENAWDALNPVTRESLDMIMHKITRIIIGREDFADHWHDIAGYAKLAEEKVCNNG